MVEIQPPNPALFFELSLDLICIAGTDGYFKFVNRAWEHCLGYTSAELMSVPYIEFVHPNDRGATSYEASNLEGGRPVLNFENRYRAKDGSWKWLSWVASPHVDGTIYAVARDVSTQKEDQKATELLLRKLELSNKELDQFAYIVSHDLKTPLRGIANLAEWIVEDIGSDLKPEVAEHLKMLQERVQWIQNLINDLLKYSRTGRSHARVGPVKLSELIEEIKSTMVLPEGFEIIVEGKLPTLPGVRIELLQLFQNLLINAVKYRRLDHGSVRIAVTNQRDHWLVRVQDDGIGIAPQHHDKVFEVFQRLGESPGIEGTGIGLAIVKKIVDAAGGRIHVESDGKSGTAFVFTWPKGVSA